MTVDTRYKGIMFMLLAALGFSIMGGAAKALKETFNAGQLSFYRNAVGLVVLMVGFILQAPLNKGGGKLRWLFFRGFMGTVALYTLLFCILHLPLGTAMSYNLTSTLFIAILAFFFFGEYHGKKVLVAVLLGFAGMLLIYRPVMHYAWYYHVAGLLSGITAALAYLTVGKLSKYYDPRVIVLSFLLSGVIVPVTSMIIHYSTGLRTDDLFIIDWKTPTGIEWFYVLILGLAALFGQYFVTRAYGADKAGIVSVFSYANIIFSVFIGMMLGDAFPGLMTWAGIACIILSGIIISLIKKRASV